MSLNAKAHSVSESAMEAAMAHLARSINQGIIVHTVSVQVNGQHGGCDVLLYGQAEVEGNLEDFDTVVQVRR